MTTSSALIGPSPSKTRKAKKQELEAATKGQTHLLLTMLTTNYITTEQLKGPLAPSLSLMCAQLLTSPQLRGNNQWD